jgi:flagellar biosynthesis component FlhA
MATALAANPFFQRLHANRGMLFPLAFISLLFVILVPLPAAMMDLLLILNLTLSAVVLITTIYVQSPLEFSVFPSLLLATTLFRLVLNAATTRLILTVGDRSATTGEAMHKAGEVILAFSNFVTGNSLAVGIIIFTIIVVIQFVVITKGATRISVSSISDRSHFAWMTALRIVWMVSADRRSAERSWAGSRGADAARSARTISTSSMSMSSPPRCVSPLVAST